MFFFQKLLRTAVGTKKRSSRRHSTYAEHFKLKNSKDKLKNSKDKEFCRIGVFIVESEPPIRQTPVRVKQVDPKMGGF